MEKLKLYVARTESGFYYTGEPKMTVRKEDAKLLSWEEAEQLQNDFFRNVNTRIIIESK